VFWPLLIVGLTILLAVVVFAVATKKPRDSQLLEWKTHLGRGSKGDWYYSLESGVRNGARVYLNGASSGELFFAFAASGEGQDGSSNQSMGRLLFCTDKAVEFAVDAEVVAGAGRLTLTYRDTIQVPLIARKLAESTEWFKISAEAGAWRETLWFDREAFAAPAVAILNDMEEARAAALRILIDSPELFPPDPEDRTVH
jgi:hypothetical protein